MTWQAFDAARPKGAGRGIGAGAATGAAAVGGPQNIEAVPLDPKSKAVIKSVQKHFGLPVTGALDPATVKALNGYKPGTASATGGSAGSATASPGKAAAAKTVKAVKTAAHLKREKARLARHDAAVREKQQRRAVSLHNRIVLGKQRGVAQQRAARNRLAAQRLKAIRSAP